MTTEDNLADALKRNRELKTGITTTHRPRRYGRGGDHRGSTMLRCTECAVWTGTRLQRAPWPCQTAQLAGVTA